MIRNWIVVIILLMINSLNTNAQKIISEGIIKYDVSMKSSSGSRHFENTNLNIYLKGKQSRSEVNSSLGSEISIFDNNTGKGAVIKEYSGQKLLILLTRENWESRNIQFRNIKFSESAGTKKINSYQCMKATAVLQNGDQLTVYYTLDYIPANKEYSFAFPGIEGLPVEFELVSKDLILKYSLKELNLDSSIVNNSLFELPKSGTYRTISYEEATHLNKKSEE